MRVLEGGDAGMWVAVSGCGRQVFIGMAWCVHREERPLVLHTQKTYIMKNFIATQLRHIISYLAGFLAFLIKQGLLTASEAEPLIAKIDGAADFLTPIIAVIVTRWAMLLLAKAEVPAWIKAYLPTVSPVLLLCVITSVGLGVALPSCSLPSALPSFADVSQNINYTGSAYYRHESGAKAGIQVSDGESASLWLKMPWFDKSASDSEDANEVAVKAAK